VEFPGLGADSTLACLYQSNSNVKAEPCGVGQ